jgi:hypothetical protein
MSTVKTRKQAMATSPSAKATQNGGLEHASLNGNGSVHGAAAARGEHPHENIFLFYPNIIGKLHPRTSFLYGA